MPEISTKIKLSTIGKTIPPNEGTTDSSLNSSAMEFFYRLNEGSLMRLLNLVPEDNKILRGIISRILGQLRITSMYQKAIKNGTMNKHLLPNSQKIQK